MKPHPGEKSLEPFDTAIGKLCRRWAQLETAITLLFLKIGNWDYRFPATYPMASFIDIRDKISALRVGVLKWNCPEEVVTLLFDSVNYVDNGLRIARNRFVHDIRMTSEDGINALHLQEAYSYAKEPASGRLTPKDPILVQVTIEEIQEVIEDIEGETTFLFRLYELFQSPHDEPLTPPLEPPPRRHLLRQKEKQSRRDKAASAQKPQQKSSPE